MIKINRQIIENLMIDYGRKRLNAAKTADLKKESLYAEIPRLGEIEKEIHLISIKISKLFLSGPENLDKEVDNLRAEIEKLKKEREEIYIKHKIPEHFLEPDYECKKCCDTGYDSDGKRCSCFNKQIINNLYTMSNMSHMLKKENFNAFNINVFSNEVYENEKLTPRQNMYYILDIGQEFCCNFHESNMNLLYYGGTGLGKTFMCNCIAKALIDKGITVLYQTSFSLFEIVETHKFNSQTESEQNKLSYDMIFDSELLIIDDLGTELNNSFTNSELFNIVNERLITEKKTIISTNLSLEKLAKTYSDRIMSRVFNNFALLKFYGKDLRWESK